MAAIVEGSKQSTGAKVNRNVLIYLLKKKIDRLMGQSLINSIPNYNNSVRPNKTFYSERVSCDQYESFGVCEVGSFNSLLWGVGRRSVCRYGHVRHCPAVLVQLT